LTLSPGVSFASYRIVEPLGRGGMASVYRAYEAALDRHVAIKVLPAEFLHDPTFAERFRREAKVIARLEHPNIIPIYAFDIEAERHIPWMSMRLVAGGALSGLLRSRQTPLPFARSITILRGVAEALDYAHAKGVVHRDVKPQNILLDEAERVYLADFGIAKMVEGSGGLTQTGMISGTPQYMAPEQATGLVVDKRADIYALGIVAFEMFTGRVPFVADTPVAILMKHVSEPLPAPGPSVPRALVHPILKCTAKKPEDRWASASEFVRALDAALGSVATAASLDDLPTLEVPREATTFRQARTVPAPQEEPAAPATALLPTAAPRPPWTRRRTGLAPALVGAGVAAAFVVVAGMAVAVLWSRRAPDAPATPAPSASAPIAAASQRSEPAPAPAAPTALPVAASPPRAPAPAPAAASGRTTAARGDAPPATRGGAPVVSAEPVEATRTPPTMPPSLVPTPVPTPAPQAVEPAVRAPAVSPQVRALLDGLASSDRDQRWRAAEALGSLGSEAKPAVPALTAALRDPNETVRWRAAEALGKVGVEAADAVPGLIASLDGAEMLATEAAKALGRLGPVASAAVPALGNALSRSDVYVRREVAKALVKMGAGARGATAALIEALDDSDKVVRAEAARALGGIGPEAQSAVPALRRALRDSEGLVASQARRALKNITGSEP
jgi:tRNA A-37 threonylcarbamoyl transferase component Bud32